MREDRSFLSPSCYSPLYTLTTELLVHKQQSVFIPPVNVWGVQGINWPLVLMFANATTFLSLLFTESRHTALMRTSQTLDQCNPLCFLYLHPGCSMLLEKAECRLGAADVHGLWPWPSFPRNLGRISSHVHCPFPQELLHNSSTFLLSWITFGRLFSPPPLSNRNFLSVHLQHAVNL